MRRRPEADSNVLPIHINIKIMKILKTIQAANLFVGLNEIIRKNSLRIIIKIIALSVLLSIENKTHPVWQYQPPAEILI